MMLKDLETLLPFIAVAFTMWATSGPNNMMLAYSGARFGVIKTLPHVCGILTGTVLLSMTGILALKPRVLSTPSRWTIFTVATGALTAVCALFLWI
jgi:threonine/homoserine/homoserine lactone efflux protein